MINIGHTDGSTNFASEMGASIYDLQLHGRDGAVLLDPYLNAGLKTIAESGAHRAIDIGSGTGPWARRLHDLGVGVVALENGEAMHTRSLEKNLKGVLHANGVRPGVIPVLADGLDMSLFGDGQFDSALSVNVGCNIQHLETHFNEMARVLRVGGLAVITAPTNLEQLFHLGKNSDDKIHVINEWLKDDPKLGPIGFVDSMLHKRHSLISHTVLRATITLDDIGNPNHLMLPTDSGLINEGDAVWRIIPGGLVVPNYYHDEKSYEEAFDQSGLELVSKVAEKIDAQSLEADDFSDTYQNFNPFAVYTVRRAA
jgi:SAM-dependent methyltransferase